MSLESQVLDSIEGIVENYEQAIETFDEGVEQGEISYEYALSEMLDLLDRSLEE